MAALLWDMTAVYGVQGAGCGRQLLLTPPFASSPPTDVTVTGFACAAWCCISKIGAATPSSSNSSLPSSSPHLWICVLTAHFCLGMHAPTCSNQHYPMYPYKRSCRHHVIFILSMLSPAVKVYKYILNIYPNVLSGSRYPSPEDKNGPISCP